MTNSKTLTFEREIPPFNDFALGNILGNGTTGKINGKSIEIIGPCIESIKNAVSNIIHHSSHDWQNKCISGEI